MKKKSFLLLLSLGILLGLFINMLGAAKISAAVRANFVAPKIEEWKIDESETTENLITEDTLEVKDELVAEMSAEVEMAVKESEAVVQTMTEQLASQSEPVFYSEPVSQPEPASQPESAEPVSPSAVQTMAVESANNIKIVGKTLEIIDVTDTVVDAGGHVNRYGKKFLYGHNSSAVFGAIVNLGEGATFSVTVDGVTTNYQVAKTVIFEKNVETGRLQLNGSGNYMGAVAKAKYGGTEYDLSIMTCYGTSYGNGDASHRFVIFANAI